MHSIKTKISAITIGAIVITMIIAAVFLARENSQFNVLYYIVLISGPFLVMTFEIINSAIEAVVDRIGNEYHELSGRAKDMGSAAVFIMLMYTLITWILVLLHIYTGII